MPTSVLFAQLDPLSAEKGPSGGCGSPAEGARREPGKGDAKASVNKSHDRLAPGGATAASAGVFAGFVCGGKLKIAGVFKYDCFFLMYGVY